MTRSKCVSVTRRHKFSEHNNMDPGPSVPELSGLTPVEQMLIAQVNPNMSLMLLPVVVNSQLEHQEEVPNQNQAYKEPWMQLYEPEQPVHQIINPVYADFDWLAHSQQYNHLMQPSCTFLIQSKNADPLNHPAVLPDPAYDLQQLNTGQRRVYDHVHTYTINPQADPLALSVLGTAGTGKSYLIHCLRQLLGQSVTLQAPTGVAAVNSLIVSVQLIHRCFSFKYDELC